MSDFYFKGYEPVMEKRREEYQKSKQEKYGNDFAHGYVGSAFSQPVKTFEEVDASFLRNLMPNKHQPIRANHSDIILNDCVNYMLRRSKDGHMNCRYVVRDIFPGLPNYDPEEVMMDLYNRLTSRKGILVYKDKRPKTLFITWVSTLDESVEKHAQEQTGVYDYEYLMAFRDHAYTSQLNDEQIKNIIMELKIIASNLKKRMSKQPISTSSTKKR